MPLTPPHVFTILIVDDRPENILSLEEILGHPGRRFLRAGSGNEALKLVLKTEDIGLIMLDVQMPDMDGFEVASTMKNSQRMKDIPIIMITSRTGEKHRERAMGMGVERYMGKPYVEEELLLNINDLVGERLAKRMARYERDGS